MSSVRVRPARPSDLEPLAAQCARLWADAPIEAHRASLAPTLAGRPKSTLPLVIFVAEVAERPVGFVEVGLRSHADGCDPARPCGFIEGWYVEPEHRGRGVGAALIRRAEDWSRAQGCVELASDTWLDNEASLRAHRALGFEVVDRCVNFRKALEPAAAYYGDELARLHHAHFGMVARAAARELLRRLRARGRPAGTVVDLAAGSGILCRAVVEAGFDAWGVDLSEPMLRLARAEAPGATFVRASLWDVALPPCVAACAIGEAFSYAADETAGLPALRTRLAAIARALEPGGLLLFDVAGSGRSGPEGLRRGFWSFGGAYLGLEEREAGRDLERRITQFVPEGGAFRRVEETHALRLYTPAEIEAALDEAGFAWERLSGYDDFVLPPGWHAWVARSSSAAASATSPGAISTG